MNISAFAPELILAGALVYGVVSNLLIRSPAAITRIGLLACGAALVATFAAPGDVLAGGMLVSDRILHLARIAILAGTAIALAAGRGERDAERQLALLGLGGGALVLAGAGNLLTLAIGVEATSLTGWLLAGWRRRDAVAAEAALKYALFGALASGCMAFGLSHAYGLAGGLAFADLGAAPAGPALAGALLLIAAGLAYKLALPPFHLYAPDVYQGSPAAAAAAFSTIPKIAALAVIVRLLMALGTAAAPLAAPVLVAAGSAAILIGGLLALAQQDARRILAFSAIVHVGSMLLALAAWPAQSGLPALGFYALVYLVLGLGSFLALGAIEAPGAGLARIRGAWTRSPAAVAALAVLLCGLAGIPPLAGFFAKWLVLRQLLETGGGLGWIGAIALLAGTALTMAAYLRVLRATAVEDDRAAAGGDPDLAWLAVLCAAGAALLSLLLGWWPAG